VTQAARPTARAGVAGGWADASLHNAPLTADLIEGARLQPASFAKLWAELSEAEQVAAADLGLEDVGDWAERYDVDWLPWLELSSRQREGAMSLGFDEPRLWPPRSVTTASLIEGNFSAPTLKRFLQCRQIKPIPQDKRARARTARSIIQEEAVVLARDGAQALSLFSPEGKSYAELAGSTAAGSGLASSRRTSAPRGSASASSGPWRKRQPSTAASAPKSDASSSRRVTGHPWLS